MIFRIKEVAEVPRVTEKTTKIAVRIANLRAWA